MNMTYLSDKSSTASTGFKKSFRGYPETHEVVQNNPQISQKKENQSPVALLFSYALLYEFSTL